MVCPCWE